jgi:hypothetical protein
MMRNEKRNVSDPNGTLVGEEGDDQLDGGSGTRRSRRWRSGERSLRAANDTTWRKQA